VLLEQVRMGEKNVLKEDHLFRLLLLAGARSPPVSLFHGSHLDHETVKRIPLSDRLRQLILRILIDLLMLKAGAYRFTVQHNEPSFQTAPVDDPATATASSFNQCSVAPTQRRFVIYA
jgi:hypothetical protein